MRRLLYIALIGAALLALHLAQPMAAGPVVSALAAPLLLTLATAVQGMLHAAFYSRDKLFLGIHFQADMLAAALFLLAWAPGSNVVALAGAALVGDFLFQLPINHGAGKPLVDRGEDPSHMTAGKDWSFKEVFSGLWRWAELVAGVALMAAGVYLQLTGIL